MRFTVAGDFNGDGKDDIAMFYDYSALDPSNHSEKVFVIRSNGSAFGDSETWWYIPDATANNGRDNFQYLKFAVASERDNPIMYGEYGGNPRMDLTMLFDYPYTPASSNANEFADTFQTTGSYQNYILCSQP